jgi:alkylation response protein AidB-like acyl-CoA dehydrogenase
MTSLVDLAIEAEELMAVETSVPLSVFSTGLGLMPLLFFGTGEQQSRLLTPFLSGRWPPPATGRSRVDPAQRTEARACRAEWLDPHASRSGRNRIDLSSRAIHLAGVS